MDKPIWKQWWFWLLVVALVIVVTPKLRVMVIALFPSLSSGLLRNGKSIGGHAMNQIQEWS